MPHSALLFMHHSVMTFCVLGTVNGPRDYGKPMVICQDRCELFVGVRY